jgi:hypothetical protein
MRKNTFVVPANAGTHNHRYSWLWLAVAPAVHKIGSGGYGSRLKAGTTGGGDARYFVNPISRKYFRTPGWIRSTLGAAATVLAEVVSQACGNFLQRLASTPCNVFASR